MHSCRRSIGLPKAVEDIRQEFRADANACIAYRNLDVRVVALDLNADSPSSRRKLYGIAKEISENLLQTVRVAGTRQTADSRAGSNLMAFASKVGRTESIAASIAEREINRTKSEFKFARDNTRDIKQIIN